MWNGSLEKLDHFSNTSLLFEPSVALAVIGSLLAITTFVGTSLCLLAFATLPALRTPFNYYLISILLAELLLSVHQIFMVIQAHYGYWPFSTRACTCLVFLFFCSAGVIGNAHFLISVNRTWALFFPHHYRTHNSKAVTKVLCASVWIASVSFILPWAILNEPFLQEPIVVCRIQTYNQYTFSTIVMVLFVSPTVFIMSTYPILYHKQQARKRVRASLGVNRFRTTSQVAPSGMTGRKRLSTLAAQDTTRAENTSHQDQHDPEHGLASNHPLKRRKSISNSFLVLTWVAFCAAVFWAPSVVYAVSEVFLHPNPWFNNQAFLGLCAWLEVANCLDPVMFIATVPLLRTQVRKLLGLGN